MNVQRMEGTENREEIIAFYFILFRFYLSLFRELSGLPVEREQVKIKRAK